MSTDPFSFAQISYVEIFKIWPLRCAVIAAMWIQQWLISVLCASICCRTIVRCIEEKLDAFDVAMTVASVLAISFCFRSPLKFDVAAAEETAK